MIRVILKATTFLWILFICAVISSATQAQTYGLDSISGSDPVVISANPQYPNSGQRVTVTIKSFTTDLGRATITWFLEGKQTESAIGATKFSFIAGSSGSSQTVDVSIVTADGDQLSKSIQVNPGDVDILWQAKSYTPPFYKGKALFPPQGDITFVALPHLKAGGIEIDSRKLVYAWKKNGEALKAQSGYGKNSLTIPGGFGAETFNISVTASAVDGSSSGIGKLSLGPINPQVIFYEDSLLYGPIYNRSLADNFNLLGQEIRVRAEPYFFSITEDHSSTPLTFTWAVNDAEVSDQQNPVITLRGPQGFSGSSLLSVQVKNATKIFQTGSKTSTINFSGQ